MPTKYYRHPWIFRPSYGPVVLQKEFRYTYLLLTYRNLEVHSSIFIISVLIESAVGLTVEFLVDMLMQ